MALEPSVEDRVLEAFLKQLAGSDAVPGALLSRLSALLSEGRRFTADDLVRIIHESASDDATTY